VSTNCQRGEKLDSFSLNSMLELLHEIPSPPDTVLAAITAALITLFGIHLQNRSNFRQLQERLDQERVERSTQRKIELRRETYLVGPAKVKI